MSVLTIPKPLDELAAHSHGEGGWGYAPGQPAQLEPTCLALLALSADAAQFADAISKGRGVFERCAGADGAYRLEQGREEAVWPTSLVLFTQSALDVPR